MYHNIIIDTIISYLIMVSCSLIINNSLPWYNTKKMEYGDLDPLEWYVADYSNVMRGRQNLMEKEEMRSSNQVVSFFAYP